MNEKKVCWGTGDNGVRLEGAESFLTEYLNELSQMAGCYNGRGSTEKLHGGRSESTSLREGGTAIVTGSPCKKCLDWQLGVGCKREEPCELLRNVQNAAASRGYTSGELAKRGSHRIYAGNACRTHAPSAK